jgi:hypothetical protein
MIRHVLLPHLQYSSSIAFSQPQAPFAHTLHHRKDRRPVVIAVMLRILYITVLCMIYMTVCVCGGGGNALRICKRAAERSRKAEEPKDGTCEVQRQEAGRGGAALT